MTVKRNRQNQPIINLDGPDGNAFSLLASAKSFCRQLNIKYGPIEEEMMAGDYYNLLKVFDREFGDFVVLMTDNSEILERFEG